MDQSPRPAREPIVNAPTVVLLLIALLVVVHVVRLVVDIERATWILIHFAFIPARLSDVGVTIPGGFPAGVTSTLTHAFLHADWLHLTINGAWLLAFGSIVARRSGALLFLALFVVCSIAGALAFYVVNPSQLVPLVGASGAISGMMGAAFRLLFSAADYGGFWVLREHPERVPRMSLAAALTDQRVLMAVAAWVGINLLFAYGLSDMFGEGEIAWEAHLGGFFAGFLLFGLFDQGPYSRG